MKFALHRRLLFTLAICFLAAQTFTQSVWAQAPKFPSKPVKVIVPFAAGGVADLTIRTVGTRLVEIWGQPVVVENRPGAGGVVAGETVMKADPDGHTLLLMSNLNAVSANLFKSLPFDAQKDFAPVSQLGSFDLVVVVPSESPHKSLAQFMAASRANPGKMNLGSINIGSTQHLSATWLLQAANLDVQVIPYNGTPAVITALRGGQVEAGVEVLGPALSQIKSGALRPLAVLGKQRAAQLSEVPTAQESGVSGMNASSWNALAAPAKTPNDVIAKINKDVAAALAHPEIAKKLRELNVEPLPSSPAELAELLASETKRWGEVMTKAKIAKQ